MLKRCVFLCFYLLSVRKENFHSIIHFLSGSTYYKKLKMSSINGGLTVEM